MVQRANAMGVGEQQLGEIIFKGVDLSVGTTPPDAAILGTMQGYSYDINDDSRLVFNVPTDWVPTTDMRVSLRWVINENYALANGEVQWRFIYVAVDQDNQLIAGGTTATVDSGDINIPTTATQITSDTFGTDILGSNLAVGDTVALQILRIALAGGVDPTADPIILQVTVEYARRFPYPRRNV